MSVVITSRIFTDEFTGTGGGGVSYPNSGVLSKLTVEIDFYSELAYLNKTLDFILGNSTITNNDITDNTSFLDDGNFLGKGIKPGMTISVVGTAFNDGSYTVLSVTTKVITITGVFAGTESIACSIYDDTPITALDFYYNLIENTAQETYLSLTDRGSLQRFTVDGIDAADLVTETNMLVASSSFGWVTNTLTVLSTGETNQVKIKGMGITAHRQSFRITQLFFIAPFALREQLINFQDHTLPDYFSDSRALKYINRIDTKFSFTDPDIPHTGSLTAENGLTNWFDQNNIRTKPEYYVESIDYEEDITAESLERLDIDKVNNVTIVLKSRNAKFAALTFIALDFIYIPLNESDYINTPDTILRQNFMNDRRLVTPFFGIGNGEYFGTDYQILTNILVTLTNASTLTITFKASFTTFLKNILKSKSDDNRNYAFSVTTQDITIATTIQTDRVPVLCDVQNMDWDKTNPDLLQAIDTLRAYNFPEIDNNPSNDVAGWEGEPVYIQFPFLTESLVIDGISPTIMRVGFQIVAKKSGQEDFILEEKIFDTSLVRKLNDVQTIDFSETRPFKDTENEYEISSIIRDASLDAGTMRGFIMSYGFILRYEFWRELIQEAEEVAFAIFQNIETPSQSWHTLIASGWTLKVRFLCDVKGYDDFVTEFEQYFDMRALEIGSPADAAPIFTSITKYFTEGGMETNGIIIGGKTKIITVYSGDFTIMPAGYDGFFGYVFADLENQGGITNRRFASTEFNSESDSPFSATPVDGGASSSHASANATINIYNFATIKVETIYDDSIGLWSRRGNITNLIYSKIGFKAENLRQFNNGQLHHWDNGVQSEFEP